MEHTLRATIEELDRLYEKATKGPWFTMDTGFARIMYAKNNPQKVLFQDDNANFIVALVNAYPAIREELSGWIACSERLPEDEKTVVVRWEDSDGERIVLDCRYEGGWHEHDNFGDYALFDRGFSTLTYCLYVLFLLIHIVSIGLWLKLPTERYWNDVFLFFPVRMFSNPLQLPQHSRVRPYSKFGETCCFVNVRVSNFPPYINRFFISRNGSNDFIVPFKNGFPKKPLRIWSNRAFMPVKYLFFKVRSAFLINKLPSNPLLDIPGGRLSAIGDRYLNLKNITRSNSNQFSMGYSNIRPQLLFPPLVSFAIYSDGCKGNNTGKKYYQRVGNFHALTNNRNYERFWRFLLVPLAYIAAFWIYSFGGWLRFASAAVLFIGFVQFLL